MFWFTSSWSAALAVCTVLATSQAHTVMTTLFVDGINQGDGVCIRMNSNGSTSNFFVNSVGSKDIACGMEGETGAARVCPAKSSSILTFEFREHPEDVDSPSLDPSHKGPAAVYLKKVNSAIASNNAAGDGWFKIWESVYDEKSGTWGTTKMIENNGHISVQVPQDIESGYYLARTELLALHAASANPPNPQFFVGCAQLFIESNGTAKPSTVRIGEGTYNLSMPGLTYNIWEKPLSLPYPTFGPTVYKATTSSSPATAPQVTTVSTAATLSSPAAIATITQGVAPSASASVQSSERNVSSCADVVAKEIETRTGVYVQTEGLKPEGCIFINGNWCAFEVPSYSDQNSCWTSSNNCWNQSDDCWNKTQPTGYNLCPIWQAKCREISNGCENGIWTGPPNKGEDITPPWPSLTGSLMIFD